MNDDRFDDMLKTCFETKFTMDTHMKAQTRRRIYEKQEQLNNSLLCFIQIAMFIMTLSIGTTVFMINQGIVGIFLMIYAAICGLISIITILLYFKNNKITGRVKLYD